MSIGPAEIIIVLVIAFLVFGPSRMPEMGRQLGRAVREFRHAADTAKSELGLDEVFADVDAVKSEVSSALGVDELKAGFNDVKGSLGLEELSETVGSVTSGVGSVKAALGDPGAAARGAVRGAVSGKPKKGKAGKAEATEATPEAAETKVAEPEAAEATAETAEATAETVAAAPAAEVAEPQPEAPEFEPLPAVEGVYPGDLGAMPELQPQPAPTAAPEA